MFIETFKNLTLSFRELRGSFNEFKIVVASIFLGVFIISAVGSISENLKSEIKNKRVEMLGGNFELSTTYQEFPNNIKSWLENNGKTTHLIELRTMLSYNSQSLLKRRIVELKAVDNNYTLVGKVLISPHQKFKLSLETKKNEKYVYFLFTNQNLNTQLKKITEWELNFFDKITTSEEVGYEKPHVNFFNLVSSDISQYVNDGYKIYALGDDYDNDINYWTTNYGAEGYLINNKLEAKAKSSDESTFSLNEAITKIFSNRD